jgi:hypothetical protein
VGPGRQLARGGERLHRGESGPLRSDPQRKQRRVPCRPQSSPVSWRGKVAGALRRGEATEAEPEERSALGGCGDGVKRRTECQRSEEGRGADHP